MIKKVGIDAGHGTDTPGKRTPDGYQEYYFNNAVKKLLIIELKRCGIIPIDCNPTEKDYPLDLRSKVANDNNVDAFVSIHYNAYEGVWGTHGGIETYYHPDAPETGGKLLAKKIHEQLIQGTKLNDRGIKTGNFSVLRKTNAPACLVECGYMDNKKEAELMKSETYRKECAIEICKGLCNYLNIKYIAEKIENSDEEYKKILKLVSPVYYNTWISFVEKHHVEGKLNVKGLVKVIFEHNLKELEKVKKDCNILQDTNKTIVDKIEKTKEMLEKVIKTL
jgi:N-acetylmuramoyl-L-alanine amidase